MRPNRSRPQHGLAPWLVALVAAVLLFWWPATDRLDLPKQVIWLAGALGLGVAVWWRRRLAPDAVSAGLALAAVALLLLRPAETAARVEGWAGWLAAVALVWLARPLSARTLRPWLARLGVGLAAVGWLQAAGLEVFNAGLAAFGGRRVVGTLGNPGLFGCVLALLLPWVGDGAAAREQRPGRGRWWGRVGLALLAGALVLSGSRSAWVMGLVGLPAWLRRRGLAALLLALAAGAGLGAGLDAAAGRARLAERLDDLGNAGGTAAGRLYIWRVALHNAGDLLGPGHGPEGFARRWPHWQRAYLAAHPDQAHFASDLRHAHADAVELLCDWGPAGALLVAWLLALALLRPAARARWRGPALGVLAAAAVGGLAAPVLFFAPCLALVALALGSRLGPVRWRVPWPAGALLWLALAAGLWPLGQRLASELARSRATAARAAADLAPALRHSRRAVERDARNPRAWIERGLSCAAAGRPDCARQAFCRAYQDLPTSALAARCRPGAAPPAGAASRGLDVR
jgi:hypothetical protein